MYLFCRQCFLVLASASLSVYCHINFLSCHSTLLCSLKGMGSILCVITLCRRTTNSLSCHFSFPKHCYHSQPPFSAISQLMCFDFHLTDHSWTVQFTKNSVRHLKNVTFTNVPCTKACPHTILPYTQHLSLNVWSYSLNIIFDSTIIFLITHKRFKNFPAINV